ncbi:hypothetical protein MRS44_008508 [Fusarium solani]|uniref:uncharacterized protein n=1 Tax=Fusarium solani TaxID=169388 RepID=UPI0032C49723|nr:hypothetical protein MRS44_008508 [Fusarium solani]
MTDSLVTLQTSSSTLQGVQDERFGRPVWHFRGIPYGRIPKRFHKPEYDALPRELDATRFGFVAESVNSDKPIVIVTFNYRLNIFAFGDGVGERNLALQDQRLALQWVSDNIRDFGGDPEKITLAGESAGAVYVHAHILSKTAPKCVRQAILASGSLHLSPPQPLEVGQGLLKRIKNSLVQALINCGVTSMWLQEGPDLNGWENRTENIDGIMISDVEYESAIWRSGVDLLKPGEILEIIRACHQGSSKLEELYHIYPERPTASRLGVLDLINDTRFALPALEISNTWRKNNKRVYQYIIDEANPWQASSRAHHAVDLIFLFGGIDLSFNPGADRVGKEMRQGWLTFMYGGSPWSESSIQAFGPYGAVEELDMARYRARRRVHCFDYLRTMGAAQCRLLSGRLGAGRHTSDGAEKSRSFLFAIMAAPISSPQCVPSSDTDVGYADGKRVGDTIKYPDTPFFRGPLQPSRLECDVVELEISGNLPKDINGTFFRVQPDPRFPPVYEEDVNFSGDGMVSAIQFRNGHVDFKQRYVRTDRFNAEDKHRKAMFGRYRNPYTDNEMVKGIIRTVSNTNVYFWRGTLLASKEDGPPFAMDPVTLETIGRYDFEGQMKAPCFTAHPKMDPDTGEMVAFAYEAGGNGHDASCDIAVWTFEPEHGKLTHERWYKAPFCGMIHDAALTKNYLILPMTPLKCELDRLKKGGNHWAWDPNEDQYYGIVPRKGDEDIIWLRADNGFHGHVVGAYEDENGHIVCDLTVADGNVFFWWPPDEAAAGPHSMQAKARQKLISDTFRWVFDPKSKTNTRVTPFKKYGTNGEFSKQDERFLTKPYNHFWQLQMDPTRPYDIQRCGPPAGGLWNVLGHYNWETEIKDVYFAGPTCTFQEPVFIPREGSKDEGDGYLVAILNHLDVQRNDILVFDALNLSQGPLAVVHLPLRLRMGLHGNFVDQREIEEWEKRRSKNGDVGPAKIATEPLPWQVEEARAEKR